MTDVLDRVARAARGRIVAALAARFRDLDLAEEAFSDACVAALRAWQRDGPPRDPAAWLYRVADRGALQILRWRRARSGVIPEPVPPATAEEAMCDMSSAIPDERLRLIFVCCHPALSPDSRVALTLRTVCGLSTTEIARAFLLPEPTLAQRLVRAKRKIAEAGIRFDIPAPEIWPERLEAVLTTLEIAYAHAHADAAGSGPHAGYAAEMLEITAVLARLLPAEPGVSAFAALVRYAEARRPARCDADNVMVPLAEQDPALWTRSLIESADIYLTAALGMAPIGAEDAARVLQARLHGVWCARGSLAEPPPWDHVLALYDRLITLRDDPMVRLNRLVAMAETLGPHAAMAELARLPAQAFADFVPYHAVRADLLHRVGRHDEAMAAYDTALALGPADAEARWLRRRRAVQQA